MGTSTAIISSGSTLFFVVALGALVRSALKRGRVTTELGAFLASFSIAWLEAVIDWGSFLYYSPAWPMHFPHDWPVVHLVPVFPVPVVLAYTWFYFGLAWIGTLVARQLHRRQPEWGRMRTVFLPTFALVFAASFTVEAVCIALGVFRYTQTWALVTAQAGTDVQHPLTMDLAMALTIAPLACLMSSRNRDGEDPIEAFASRRMAHSGRDLRPRLRDAQPSDGPLAVASVEAVTSSLSPRRRVAQPLVVAIGWIVALHAVYVPVSLGYCLLRWTDVETSVSTVRPYPRSPPLYDANIIRPHDAPTPPLPHRIAASLLARE